MTLLLAYYGDDFTGSTDVMEALQWSGLRTVLFLDPPTPEQLARFSDLRAFGVAGWSRTMSPAEMDSQLKPILEKLRGCGAPIVHYKICSTFDSSPQIGSIGKALELGREIFATRCIPVLVGAPPLGRYQVFGNLFARSGLDSEPSRLDRHPTMKQHPITPMAEADLRLHLAQQTTLDIALVDVLRLSAPGAANGVADWIRDRQGAALLDVLDVDHLAAIGEILQQLSHTAPAEHHPLYVVGSSGVQYALSQYWQKSGQLDAIRSHAPGRPDFDAVDQLVVITGSCSPVNDRQIAWAIDHGFIEIPLDAARLVDPATTDAETQRAVDRALDHLDRGASVILHSSRGPADPRIGQTQRQYQQMGFSDQDIKLKSGRTLGPKLGRILKLILQQRPLRRAAVAGGDTSGYVARELGIEALEAIAPVAPGSPLCRAVHSGAFSDLEIIFKGGQVGRDPVWGTLLNGNRSDSPTTAASVTTSKDEIRR